MSEVPLYGGEVPGSVSEIVLSGGKESPHGSYSRSISFQKTLGDEVDYTT